MHIIESDAYRKYSAYKEICEFMQIELKNQQDLKTTHIAKGITNENIEEENHLLI